MNPLPAVLERKLAALEPSLAVVLPGGQHLGSAQARVTLTLHDLASLGHVARGEIGRVAQDHVEGRVDFDGSVRDLMAVATQTIKANMLCKMPPVPMHVSVIGGLLFAS